MFFNITPKADTQLSVPPAYRRSMEISSLFYFQTESFWSLAVFFFLSGDALDELLSKKDETLEPIGEQTKEMDERYSNIVKCRPKVSQYLNDPKWHEVAPWKKEFWFLSCDVKKVTTY